MRTTLLISILIAPTLAIADPENFDVALRSQIGWGASINPDRVGFTSEGGWNGGDRRGVASAAVEATVMPRLSLLVNATYGGDTDHGRPAIGAAYQLIDPRRGDYGARLSLSYKPEGFTEPDGEIESVLVGSLRVAGGVARAMLAYGQDADRKESDAEAGASLIERAAPNVIIGATFRYRRGLIVKAGEPAWDLIGGAVAGLAFGRSRLELLVGADGIKFTTDQWGLVGLLSIGTEL